MRTQHPPGPRRCRQKNQSNKKTPFNCSCYTCYKGILDKIIIIHMFREIVNYCVTNAASSGTYSLSLIHLATEPNLYSRFWSGNVFHQLSIGTGLRGFLVPRKILTLIAFLISLFETPPPVCMLDCNGREIEFLPYFRTSWTATP